MPFAALIAPGGSASSAATATVASCQRGPSISAAAKTSSAAVAIIVRCVPTTGIATRAAPNVPRMLPIVESPYSRPATVPAVSTVGSASRIANGLTAPSSVTGTANSSSAARNEPTTAPIDAASSSRTVAPRNGRATNGITATANPATRTILPSSLASGRRSASRPPNQ